MLSLRTVRVRAWALALGVVQVAGTFGASHNQPGARHVDALAVLLVLVGPVLVLLRDLRPLVVAAGAMAAAVVYVGAGYAYGPVFLSVMVGLFLAGLDGHRRDTWLLAGAGYVAYVVAALGLRDDGAGSVNLALVAGWLIVVLAVGEVARTRRDSAAERARAREEQERHAAGQQRLELAQELHDVLAHHISLINVQAGVALHLVDEQPEQARTALAHIKVASKEALQELRAALDLLRRPEDEAAPRAPAPTLEDLDRLVEAVRAGGLGVDLVLDVPDSAAVPAAAAQLAAYRIVQEALTNVTRHASASRVTVRVLVTDGIDVDVCDDGIGGVPAGGNGIAGMRERAGALGGTFEAGPVASGGFRVRAHLPAGAT